MFAHAIPALLRCILTQADCRLKTDVSCQGRIETKRVHDIAC